MKILGLVPARSGSKGIPGKNTNKFCGRPLLAWTIEAARESGCIDRVVVSTESQEVADVAVACGADVPFLRPAALATDETPAYAPVVHALTELPDYDWVMLLQPTSPLRSSLDIQGIAQLAEQAGVASCVSVCEAPLHPYFTYREEASGRLTPFIPGVSMGRRQELPTAYGLNGAMYLVRCDWFMNSRRFIAEETLGYVMAAERSVDIDDPIDWKWAEFLMKEKLYG